MPHRTYISTASFRDAKHVKEGGVSIDDDGHSIRYIAPGMQSPDGKMGQYNVSIAGFRNYY